MAEAFTEISRYARMKMQREAWLEAKRRGQIKQGFLDDITDSDFAERYLKIQKKNGVIAPLKFNRIQRHLTAALTGRDLIVKPRQVGMSTSIQAVQFKRVAFGSDRAATLAHDFGTTQKMRTVHALFYNELPESVKPEREQNNASTISYPALHGQVTLTTAGNTDAGIGSTYNFVHGTEVARWKDAAAIMSGLLQGVPKDGTIILESTPFGARGWFYEMCMQAIDGDSRWALHFYPWWWEYEYRERIPDGEELVYTPEEWTLVERHGLKPEQIQWRRMKKVELPYTFAQEYPEDARECFLSSGNSAFGDIRHALTAPENPEYLEGHRYMAGVDWGQDADFTAISIMDATDDVEVFVDHFNRMPWEAMVNRIVDACKRWRVETIQPERNSIGSVNIENLARVMEERNLEMTIRPITMTNVKKQKLVSLLYTGIHTDGLQLLPDKEATTEMNVFQQSQMESGLYKFEAASGMHDDIVIARKLAYDAVRKMI